MLLLIGLILVALWLAGFIVHIGGEFIHILLLIAIILFIVHFISGSRRRAVR